MSDADRPQHPIAVAARRTGLKADLIRAWERRYGAVTPGRDEHNQRLFSDHDVARLCLLRDAVGHGRAIGGIAGLDDEQLAALVRDDRRSGPHGDRHSLLPAATAAVTLEAAEEAVLAADGARLFAILEQAAVDHGVAGAVVDTVLPLTARLEQLATQPGQRRAAVQLARNVVRIHLASLAAHSLPAAGGAPGVALATLENCDDDHRLLAAAALAADAGWRSVPLGAGLPVEEIAAGCAAGGIDAVVVDCRLVGRHGAAARTVTTLRRLLPEAAVIGVEDGTGLAARVGWGRHGMYRVTLDALGRALISAAALRVPSRASQPAPEGVVLPAGDRARHRFELDHLPATADGRALVLDLATVHRLAARLGRIADSTGRRRGETSAGTIVGAAAFVDLARRLLEPSDNHSDTALGHLETALGTVGLNEVLEEVARRYATRDPATGTCPPPAAARVVGELAALWTAAHNPAIEGLRELLDADDLEAVLAAAGHGDRVPRALAHQLPLAEPVRTIVERHSTDLVAQLETLATLARRHGVTDLELLLLALDLLREERRPPFQPAAGPPPPVAAPVEDGGAPRPVREPAWAAGLVLQAKHTLVWLDQLTVRSARPITRLDQVPDEALASLAADGVTGLWLVGLWDRSRASESIKRMMGNPEAAASAYAIRQYRVAPELGGDRAVADLAERAHRHGIRLGCDVVANHTGIDSLWLLEHPERFLSRPDPPYPSYTFDGPDLSPDPRIAIQLADQYYDRSDAPVVFRRTDHASGETRYVYHGNDGTGLPWNDTAQLDILQPATRAALVETIVEVARRFPILRFDAAMTLASRHVRRLWYPSPGEGGAIPSRSGHGVPAAELERVMPREFWLEVVEAVERAAPDCLLVAEAFWLMEWPFARTLGMHRVYHSAFMHLLRDGDAGGLQDALASMLRTDPGLLGQMVNYLTTPDELPAVEQFGRRDRYLAAATLLATLPGTPLLGHGQVEGLAERYGMEYRRAYHREQPDPDMVDRHRREIAPLLRDRRRFADPAHFQLLALEGEGAADVIAFVNRDPRSGAALVAVNLSGTARRCRAVGCAARRDPATDRVVRSSLPDALGLDGAEGRYAVLTDPIRGGRAVVTAAQLSGHGLPLALGPTEARVLLDPVPGRESLDGPHHALAASLDGALLPHSEPLPPSHG